MTQQHSQSKKYIYSNTCVKRPLKIDITKILMTNGSLMQVKSIAECSPWSILHTFDLHYVIIGLENQFVVVLRVAILHRFYCTRITRTNEKVMILVLLNTFIWHIHFCFHVISIITVEYAGAQKTV